MKLVEDNKGHIDWKYGKFDKYMSKIDTEKNIYHITLKSK